LLVPGYGKLAKLGRYYVTLTPINKKTKNKTTAAHGDHSPWLMLQVGKDNAACIRDMLVQHAAAPAPSLNTTTTHDTRGAFC
jgi:hypothetical protein